MTREELRDYVDEQRTLNNIPYHVYSTLIDGIDTLEQEPINKNDLGIKLISKNDVDRIIDCPYFRQADKLIQIMNLPSVTPQEPKIGHWIGHREHCENLGVIPSGLGAYEWCSNCDCGIDVREWHKIHYNYCPNCGADMRGEE